MNETASLMMKKVTNKIQKQKLGVKNAKSGKKMRES